MFNEVHCLQGQTILLITKPSLLSTALLHYLKTTLNVDGRIHDIQRPLEVIPGNGLILFDMSVADREHIYYWQEVLCHHEMQMRVLLVNMPQSGHTQAASNWPRVTGVFYASESENSVIEGIESILRGERGFSGKLAGYLLSPAHTDKAARDTSLLTQREKEILDKLKIGASNNEIARSLFISENTVKTHLYNLFRKISVKNRTQAVSWANNHLMQ